jgi:hypothetical protein
VMTNSRKSIFSGSRLQQHTREFQNATFRFVVLN